MRFGGEDLCQQRTPGRNSISLLTIRLREAEIASRMARSRDASQYGRYPPSAYAHALTDLERMAKLKGETAEPTATELEAFCERHPRLNLQLQPHDREAYRAGRRERRRHDTVGSLRRLSDTELRTTERPRGLFSGILDFVRFWRAPPETRPALPPRTDHLPPVRHTASSPEEARLPLDGSPGYLLARASLKRHENNDRLANIDHGTPPLSTQDPPPRDPVTPPPVVLTAQMFEHEPHELSPVIQERPTAESSAAASMRQDDFADCADNDTTGEHPARAVVSLRRTSNPLLLLGDGRRRSSDATVRRRSKDWQRGHSQGDRVKPQQSPANANARDLYQRSDSRLHGRSIGSGSTSSRQAKHHQHNTPLLSKHVFVEPANE